MSFWLPSHRWSELIPGDIFIGVFGCRRLRLVSIINKTHEQKLVCVWSHTQDDIFSLTKNTSVTQMTGQI